MSAQLQIAAGTRPGTGNLYWMIFRQLFKASYVFTSLTLLSLVLLLATQLFGSAWVATGIFALTWLGMLIIGGGLGFNASSLWGRDSQLLVPDYHRRLIRVISATAFLVWLVVALSYAVGHADHGIQPVVDALWLWCYGLLSCGFMLGFFMARSAHWLLRGVPVMIIVLPTIFPEQTHWLFASFTPYTPITVLSLLCGPHNWPLFFDLYTSGRKRGMWFVQRTANAETHKRSGSMIDGYVLRELQHWLHSKVKTRPEFMIFPPTLVTALWTPLAGAWGFGFIVCQFNGIAPSQACRVILPLVAVLTVLLAHFAPFDRGILGRSSLLPDARHRYELPAWLALRHFMVTTLVSTLLWMPSAIVAFWAGASIGDVGRFAVAILLCLINATALQIFFLPSRASTLNSVRAVVTVAVAVGASVIAGRIVDADNFAHLLEALGMSLGCSAVLYLWGLQRCKAMELGS